MAKETTKTVQDINQDGKIQSADALFDQLGGQEIFVDRAIADWDELGDKKLPVVGHLVRCDQLNLPPGTKRADGRQTWDAYVFNLTRPTRAVMNKNEIVDVPAGRQVYVARNPKNAKDLDAFLGHEHMVEVAILATTKIPTANRDMWTFRIKEVGNPKKREGQFLVGGPGHKPLPVPMPGDATPAEREAARNEVPFS